MAAQMEGEKSNEEIGALENKPSSDNDTPLVKEGEDTTLNETRQVLGLEDTSIIDNTNIEKTEEREVSGEDTQKESLTPSPPPSPFQSTDNNKENISLQNNKEDREEGSELVESSTKDSERLPETTPTTDIVIANNEKEREEKEIDELNGDHVEGEGETEGEGKEVERERGGEGEMESLNEDGYLEGEGEMEREEKESDEEERGDGEETTLNKESLTTNNEGEESRDQTTPTADESSSTPTEGGDEDRATPTEDTVGVASNEPIPTTRRRSVRFSDDVQQILLVDETSDSDHRELTQINGDSNNDSEQPPTGESSPAGAPPSTTGPPLPGLPQFSAEELISGVVYQAQYLGSTPIMFSSSQKTVRMQQAREAVLLIKDPENETQPRIDVELKISTKSIIIADKKTETDLMTHPLRTVSYVADIEGSLVVMVHRTVPASPGQQLKLTCHVLDTLDPRIVAMVIGQAFSTAYKEFLKSHGMKEESMEQFEYQHILNSQTKSEVELNSFKDEDKTKEITFAKQKGDILGLVVIDSGYGSMIPSCIIAHMNKTGAASQSGLVNVGDQILSINGVSLVGMPLKIAIEQIKKCKALTVVKMTTCQCPAVIDVTIMRPDLKFQLGFSVKEGNICSLWRGSIAERSGIRVGHRIIEINGTSAVGLSHEEMVHMLSTTVGDLHIRTMPIVLYQLLTGQLTPEYY